MEKDIFFDLFEELAAGDEKIGSDTLEFALENERLETMGFELALKSNAEIDADAPSEQEQIADQSKDKKESFKDILADSKWIQTAPSGSLTQAAAKEYYNNIQKKFKEKTLRNRSMLNTILALVKKGKNAASQHSILESLKINDDWIINIEGNINHIDNIVRNPKSALKEERLIVNTSKAKRTDSETIRYLSSHTSDIESIVGEEIRPSRLNVREIDSDIATYENRFVYALMVRLRSFLEQRYTAIKEQIDCYDSNELKMNSKFNTFGGGDIEYNLSIKLRDKRTDSVSVKENHSLLERIESCRLHLSALMGSDFARTLAKSKLLMPPINKTNAIRGHVDYRGCYNLWLFLSSYTAVGYSVKVDEQNLELTNDYYDDLSFIIAMSVKNMMDNNRLARSLFNAGEIRHRIKKIKPVKNFSYSHTRQNIPPVIDDQKLAQYYFDKIKKLLKESDAAKEKTGEPQNIAFRDYFKNVKSLSDQLFDEVLELNKYRKAINKAKTLDAKKENLAHYNECLKRIKLLRRLKESDYKATLREEKNAERKIAKLRAQIKDIKENPPQKAPDDAQGENSAATKKLTKREREKLKIARQKEKARLAKQRERERAKLAKQKEKDKEKLAKEREIEKAKQAKLKAQERAKLAKQKEKDKEKLAKEREIEKAKQAKLKEQEKAKLAKQKEKDKEKLAKEREIEKAKQAKLKEQEELRLAKQKEKEKERLAKEREIEKAKQAKLKEQEKAKQARQKEKEKEKLAKEKERERQAKIREAEKAKQAKLKEQERLKQAQLREEEKERFAKLPKEERDRILRERRQEKERIAREKKEQAERIAREQAQQLEIERLEKELEQELENERKRLEMDVQESNARSALSEKEKLDKEAEQERLRKEVEKAWEISLKKKF